MRDDIRSLHAFGFCVVVALALFAFPASAQVGVTVTVNGNAVNLSPGPLMQGGRVFVPLRGVFEQLGASVAYSDGAIDASGNGRTILLRIGSTKAIVDGQPTVIDVAPFIVGESTYVPLRFISESLGAAVEWSDASQTVAITFAGAPETGLTVSDTVDLEPPPIPVYEQPDVPDANYLWQPGYWAWGLYGYYWVPGTWVAPPQPGYLWTPGYWTWQGGNYVWIAGYWATEVGFYGGINYGAGYYGHGYVGGRWSGRVFQYNTYVTHVNTTIIRNVYVDRTVYVNNSGTRVSYNGGSNGIRVRPTAQDAQVARLRHLGVTAAQERHDQAAAQDRQLLATVNHNRPPVLAVARPLSTSNRPEGFVPVKPADRVAVPVHAPAVHAAPVSRAVPERPAATSRPPERPAATSRPPERPVDSGRPQARATPPLHLPSTRPEPERQAPTAKPAPAYHPAMRAAPAIPAVRATPEYHPPVRATSATPYRAPERATPQPQVQIHAPVRVTPAPHAPPPAATLKRTPPQNLPHPTEPPKVP